MANLIPKVPAEAWLEMAKRTLIDEGFDAIKVDRLAQKLGVTRGGFYHHFIDRSSLLDRLLKLWQMTVVFIPPGPAPTDPGEAVTMIEDMVDRLINEDAYDPNFDMAVRAWAHGDEVAARAIAAADASRIDGLQTIFLALGCEPEEASVRAQVFYFHQIGYYAIGVSQTSEVRRQHIDAYLRILCGEDNLTAARHWRAVRAEP
jgi:AcrR family transcriptional regulator